MGKYNLTICDHHLQILFACALFAFIVQVHGQSNDTVPLTLIDGAVQKGAVCIDGSPGGYHYDPGSGDGVDNWLVYLMGGGWCGPYTCYLRIGQFHGSTNDITDMAFNGIMSSNQTINPDFYNWNRVYVRYCDGSSFLGDTEQEDHENIVQLRGSKIFSAVMDELLNAKGMKNANNAILAGGSAGGLATILNCDRFRALVPQAKNVKCIADGGFFVHAKDLPYAEFRERVFAKTVAFHNLTNLLPESCTSKMNASLCLFPEYLVGDVRTPLFLLNPIFDSYQVQVNLRPNPPDDLGWNSSCTSDIANSIPVPNPNICTPSQMQLIKDFGGALVDAINGLPSNPSRGLYITACYGHVLSELNEHWTRIHLQDKTMPQAISDWYFDRSPVTLIDNHTDAPVDCIPKVEIGSTHELADH